MRVEPTFEGLLAEIDAFLKIPPADIAKASQHSIFLSRIIGALRNIVRLGPKHTLEMGKRVSAIDAAAVRLSQSVINYKRGGALSADWARFAQRDLRRFKDELMAFREFMLAHAEAFKSCLRKGSLSGDVNIERLIRELHDAQAIGERTFVVLMNYLAQNGRPKIKHPETLAQLSRISAYLSELHEIRGMNSCQKVT